MARVTRKKPNPLGTTSPNFLETNKNLNQAFIGQETQRDLGLGTFTTAPPIPEVQPDDPKITTGEELKRIPLKLPVGEGQGFVDITPTQTGGTGLGVRGGAPSAQPTIEVAGIEVPIPSTIKTEEQLAEFKRRLQMGGVRQGVLTAEQLAEQKALREQGLGLSGQVGELTEGVIEPTGFDFARSLTSSLVGAIPTALGGAAGLAALSFGLGGAKIGALGGGTAGGPAGALIGAAIGGIGGFITGVVSGMISDMKEQRREITQSQLRVLEEGKQTLQDWVTLAEQDPANRMFYLTKYNEVSSQIQQAYRIMKLDTQRDVFKFESAIPDLAEFEAFYAEGGERDRLDIEMQVALQQPKKSEYNLIELAYRRRTASNFDAISFE
jgi:hypothetical protein